MYNTVRSQHKLEPIAASKRSGMDGVGLAFSEISQAGGGGDPVKSGSDLCHRIVQIDTHPYSISDNFATH